VIGECDLETHGFIAEGWRGNTSDDPAWREAYLDRAVRTVERGWHALAAVPASFTIGLAGSP